jgi:hypothetical protein
MKTIVLVFVMVSIAVPITLFMQHWEHHCVGMARLLLEQQASSATKLDELDESPKIEFFTN